ncbi:hypothetical protein [Cytobacillus sp.]|nr:hypothetical protein [Cytobacillus sp.]
MEKRFKITAPEGLHARPSPFVAMANKAAKTGKTKGSHADTSTNVRV